MLTQEYLKQVFDYDPCTGIFKHKTTKSSNATSGKVAGYLHSTGYVRIKVDDKQYRAHRLAWLFIYGELPDGDIDHIDGNRSNNKISNLRKANRSQNQQNLRSARKDNSTGYLGVSNYNKSGKFKAQIKLNGESVNLGVYETPELAHIAYINAKRGIHPFSTI